MGSDLARKEVFSDDPTSSEEEKESFHF